MKVELHQRRVLLVEDDPATRELIRLHLTLAGFDVEEACDGNAAVERVRAVRYGLLILDLRLPGIDGFMVCRVTRAGGPNRDVPILMLSALGTEADKVIGLENGADDYLAKPFGIRELLARTSAVLRRARRAEQGALASRVVSRDVALDAQRRQALVRGERVALTRHEFDLLYVLAARPGIVFSRHALVSNVCGTDADATERTIDTLVSRLRRKIERDPGDPELVLTAWGVGYKFADRG